MQFKDPCKQCIIKMCCSTRCDSRQDYLDTKCNVVDVSINATIFISCIKIMIIGIKAYYR